jgi:hypothetical protein
MRGLGALGTHQPYDLVLLGAVETLVGSGTNRSYIEIITVFENILPSCMNKLIDHAK